ncbi:MAG: hypothetical protein FH756_01780 [Firmicutes bacterium]|nr:hypothetical protein [Bacillota bacterium]
MSEFAFLSPYRSTTIKAYDRDKNRKKSKIPKKKSTKASSSSFKQGKLNNRQSKTIARFGATSMPADYQTAKSGSFVGKVFNNLMRPLHATANVATDAIDDGGFKPLTSAKRGFLNQDKKTFYDF